MALSNQTPSTASAVTNTKNNFLGNNAAEFYKL